MERRIVILSFTRAGTGLNRILCGTLQKNGRTCRGYAVEKYAGGDILPLPKDRQDLFREGWGRDAFLFVGAAGIAVRYIAPWVKDKYTDSPVLVIDETGRYVIPLLSGHVGGAAALADEIAGLTGAVPVHTTATDVRGKFAVDVFARKNDLLITDREMAKAISSAVLEGERVALYVDCPGCTVKGDAPAEAAVCSGPEEAERYRYRILIGDACPEDKKAGTLLLKPRNIAAGIGCRKAVSPELLEKGFREILGENGLEMGQVKMIASIDLKKEEPALLHLSETYGIPFVTYTAEELRRVAEVTSASGFVEKVTGVDNVCERAALLCGSGGTLIQGKCVRESMTAALVRCPAELEF